MFADETIKKYLPVNFMPTAQDVVCARGKEAYLHPGNKRYREIIVNNICEYAGAESKNEKSVIVMSIVEKVRTDAPAGFVRYCNDEQLWFQIGDEAAREKVGQSIRETLTQQDPNKRAKKRIKRAINKAKRVAAMEQEAQELEPLPVEEALQIDLSSRSYQPLPLSGSQPAPPSLLFREAQNCIPHAPQLRASASINELQFQYEAVSLHQCTLSPAPLRASTSTGLTFQREVTPFSFPPPPALLRASTSSDLRFFRGNGIPPLPQLRTTTSKDLEDLASVPPSMNDMASREWFTNEGYQMQDADFENIEQLFDERRGDRSLLSLSAAA